MWAHNKKLTTVERAQVEMVLGEKVLTYSEPEPLTISLSNVTEHMYRNESVGRVDEVVYKAYLNLNQDLYPDDRVTFDGATYEVITPMTRFRRHKVVTLRWVK